VLSEEEEERERADRAKFAELERRFRTLETQRHGLIEEMRKLSAEQKALYDRRQAPQQEVERLYDEHGALGKKLAELRGGLEKARRHFEASVIALRELHGAIPARDRVNPEQLKREIALLEHRQQTSVLSLVDEKALIDRLRQISKDLKEIEKRAAVVAAHEKQRKEAEARVAACRAEVDRLGAEFARARHDRDAKMGAVRSKLETAGQVVAELRAKGKARAEIMDRIDVVSREMMELDREGRKLHGESRARREEAMKTLRAYTKARSGPREDVMASVAEANLTELLKRGKVTLGG
jgi:uncharacterized coiled-coil DUF342 family protein